MTEQEFEQLPEQMIKDYLREFNTSTYLDEGGYISFSVAGEWVLIEEISESGYEKDDYKIRLLNILAWVYSKIKVTE